MLRKRKEVHIAYGKVVKFLTGNDGTTFLFILSLYPFENRYVVTHLILVTEYFLLSRSQNLQK